VGNTPRSQLIAQAFASRLGNGGASFMQLGIARPVESVAFGCYWRQAVLDIGGFDESIVRGQDWDLNLRLRKAGHTLWYMPDIDVEYTTRSDFTALWQRQYLAGLWKPYIHRKNGMPFLFRHWIPACFVALLLAELTLSLFHLAGFGLFIGTALIHMGASFLQRVSLKIPWQMSAQFWWAIAVIHCAYGLGFWRGYLGIATARSQMKPS
jgi:succinoglycan biosynthesis protein ExoA